MAEGLNTENAGGTAASGNGYYKKDRDCNKSNSSLDKSDRSRGFRSGNGSGSFSRGQNKRFKSNGYSGSKNNGSGFSKEVSKDNSKGYQKGYSDASGGSGRKSFIAEKAPFDEEERKPVEFSYESLGVANENDGSQTLMGKTYHRKSGE